MTIQKGIQLSMKDVKGADTIREGNGLWKGINLREKGSSPSQINGIDALPHKLLVKRRRESGGSNLAMVRR